MQYCFKMYNKTNHAFNPLLCVERIGYVDSYINPNFSVNCDTVNFDFEAIDINCTTNKIILKNGQKLDLGGVVKGWTVDRAVEKMHDLGKYNFLINAGGDIFASGKVSCDQMWSIGLDGSDKVFEIENEALATSGNIKRCWHDECGKKYHHILNSSSMTSSANDFNTITVIGDSCADCDVLATAAFSMDNGDSSVKLLENNNKKYSLYHLS